MIGLGLVKSFHLFSISVLSLKVAEIVHLMGDLFGSAPAGKSLVAIGLYYQQLANDTKSYFYYR
jgi:hypothetical protein